VRYIIYFYSKGLFVVQFTHHEDYHKFFEEGPWFWGRVGLFMTPWFPEFDPSIMVVAKMLDWVYLPSATPFSASFSL
jgi:hypothetical protein